MIKIRETQINDMKNVQSLWLDGDVMRYVGFPEGLRESDDQMMNWLTEIEKSRPAVNHYSIYNGEKYCGETFYRIHASTGRAALDIKLFAEVRGKGIAKTALQFAIQEAFKNGAVSAYVTPDPENSKAIALYEHMEMTRKEMPSDLFDRNYPDALFYEIRRICL